MTHTRAHRPWLRYHAVMARWVKKQCPVCQLERSFPSKIETWTTYLATGDPVCGKCLAMITDRTLNAYSIQDGRVVHMAPDRWLRHGPPDMGV